jgi:hypothetical protein
MCFFITIGIPNAAVEEVLCRRDRGLQIDATHNPSAIAAAGPGLMPLLVTGGGCSCGWYQRLRSGSASAKRLTRAQARYRRLGWSQAKIQRALGSMQEALQPAPGDGLHPVIVDLVIQFARAHGTAAVWVHDFEGKVEAEPYTIVQRIQCAAEELKDRAGTLELDVVITVR